MSDTFRKIYRTLKRWWMAFASALGWVNTRILLSIVYFTLFAIGAVTLRILRKDLLDRKGRRGASYWTRREQIGDSLERSRHQF
ncbi:MAG TPA: SxtJ family membrane protein [Bacteroidota bacterium]|nr:SxtJ family membrane protein [Bacteroidota bacterium]